MEGWKGGIRVAVTGAIDSSWAIISSADPFPTSVIGNIGPSGMNLVIVPEEWFPVHVDTSFGGYGAMMPGLPHTYVVAK